MHEFINDWQFIRIYMYRNTLCKHQTSSRFRAKLKDGAYLKINIWNVRLQLLCRLLIYLNRRNLHLRKQTT